MDMHEFSQAIASLAIQVAEEHHKGQPDIFVQTRVEFAVEALLQAKRHLSAAHRHIHGEAPITGVA